MNAQTLLKAVDGLYVEVVDTWVDFQSLHSAWENLRAQDPESSVFLSWEWMQSAFRAKPYRWSVLVVRSAEAPEAALCILPLKYRVHWSHSQQEFHSELEAGGRLLDSPYTGMLCAPEFESPCLARLADKLAQMPWVRLSLQWVAQGARTQMFAQAMQERGMTYKFRSYASKNGGINYLDYPQLSLPESFETYLETCLDGEPRRQFHRFQRRILAQNVMQFSIAERSSASNAIADLLKLAHDNLKAVESRGSAKRRIDGWAKTLQAAQAQGDLFLLSLQKDGQTVAALGHVLDPQHGHIHVVGFGIDPESDTSFAPTALYLQAIEWAIEQGYEVYDFGSGTIEDAAGFGAQSTKTEYLELRRLDPHPQMVFDSIGTGQALERIERYIREGKSDRAARGCKQLALLLS